MKKYLEKIKDLFRGAEYKKSREIAKDFFRENPDILQFSKTKTYQESLKELGDDINQKIKM